MNRGAILITAGPGTGKTRTLTSWIVRLIEAHEAPPSSILAITFTNKAAREMASRLDSSLRNVTSEVTVCTFHALCFELLRQRFPHLIAVYDESARETLLRLLRPDLSGKRIKLYSSRLQRLMEGTSEPDLPTEREVPELLRKYREKMDAIGTVDVSDVITKLNSLFTAEPAFLRTIQNRFRFIAVDEFQDINANQYRLLAHLIGDRLTGDSSDEKGFLAIGDPDQAIYGFRGSDLRLFFQFREDYQPQEIVLSANYRSTPSIVEAAKGLIAHNTLKSEVPLEALRSGMSKIHLSRLDRPFDEALFVARTIEEHLGGMSHISIDELESRDEGSYSFSDFAVLARTRAVRDEMIPVLSARGIPLSLGENRSIASTPPLSDALSVLKLIVNPRDLSGVSELFNLVLPDVGLSAVRENLLRWSEADSSLPDLLESLHDSGALPLESLRAFEQFIDFFEDLKSHSGDRGLADTLKRIWKWFSKEETDTDTLLRGEALMQMAKEYESNIGGFLRRIALSPFESEGPFKTERVSLLTFHAAKGLEFPVVYVVGAEEGTCPISGSDSRKEDSLEKDSWNKNSLEEGRRLFYVALTRAKDRLYITSCARRRVFGTWKEMNPSRFLDELPDESTEILTTKIKPSKESEQQLTLF
jgi:superfamily I DNA/RNA helicase